MKSSYSQNSLYTNCSKRWSWEYQHKYKPIAEGASLYFGSAVDDSVMALLDGKPDYMGTFHDKWRRAFKFGKATPIFDNENIVYANGDFDVHVLSAKDKDQLLLWAAELKVGDSPDGVVIFKEILKTKKNPYKQTSKEQMTYFNRASWLSMKRKGEILIESFKTQFLPKIKKVIATQKYAKIEGQSGDVISGYIDMVLEIEGYDKPIIFDLKTAAQPYEQNHIDVTEQLTLYQAMAGKDYNTDLVGYIVLCKNIPKDTVSYCKTCNHKKAGKHKTCDNEVNEERCGGEWNETLVLKPEVQVLVEKKSLDQVQDLLKDYGNIMHGMKEGVVFKNTSKCQNWYGNPCAFRGLCFKGDTKGLKKANEL